MKLVQYELRKLRGIRYLWVMLVVFAVFCAGTFYFQYRTFAAVGKNSAEFDSAVKTLAKEYMNDTSRLDRVRTEYEINSRMIGDAKDELNAKYEAQYGVDYIFDDSLMKLYSSECDRIEREFEYKNTLGFYENDGEEIPDIELYRGVIAYLSDQTEFRNHIEQVVRTSDLNLHRIEIRGGIGTPLHEYQLHFNTIYKRVADNVYFEGPKAGAGWNFYYEFDSTPVFIFLFLVLASGAVFLNERACGTLSIIRITRKGRLKTALAKLAALIILDIFAVIVFTLAVTLTCAAMFDMSGGNMPIQSLLDMWNCPYLVSIWGFWLMQLLMRCFCAVVFSCISAAAAAISLSPPITYAVGALVLTGNMIVNYIITFNDAIRINLIGMASMDAIADYSEILVFGHYHSTLLTGIVFFAAVAVLTAAAAVFFGMRRSAVPSTARLRGFVLSVKRRVGGAISRGSGKKADGDAVRDKSRTKGKGSVTSLYAWEIRKLATPGAAAVVAVLFAASAYTSYVFYTEKPAFTLSDFEEYLGDEWLGELTDEMAAKINAEYDEFEYITSTDTWNEKAGEYLSGQITEAEFEEYRNKYYDIIESGESTERLFERYKYLDEQKKLTGVNVWVVPTIGLSRLFARNINVWRFAAVIFIFARMYTCDYAGKSSEGNFAALLRSTKRGRRDSYRAKVLSMLTLSVILSLLFELSDLAVGIAVTDHIGEMLAAPVLSVPSYVMFTDGITVGGFIAVSVLLRTLATVILAALTCASSFLMKKLPPALILTSVFTLVPYALVYMGVGAVRAVDFTPMIAGGLLLLRSAEQNVFGQVYAFALLLAAGYMAVAAASSLYVRWRTGK